jgi:hypothetical protein
MCCDACAEFAAIVDIGVCEWFVAVEAILVVVFIVFVVFTCIAELMLVIVECLVAFLTFNGVLRVLLSFIG